MVRVSADDLFSQLITNTLEHYILYLELDRRQYGAIGDSIAQNYDNDCLPQCGWSAQGHY
jgi:hypothetical protein